MPMKPAIRVSAGLLAVVLLAGCGSTANQSIAPSSRVEHIPGTSLTRIVLSAPGARRIGIQTVRVNRAHRAGASVVVPYSAVIYDPSGRTFAFRALSPLTFTEARIRIARISGNSAYLRSGLAAGVHVVSEGAEELYGVQSGVFAQT
jgi:hypothetical protein